MCKSCSSTQILQEIGLFSKKFYTAGTNFTRPPVATVATNLKSGPIILKPEQEKEPNIFKKKGRTGKLPRTLRGWFWKYISAFNTSDSAINFDKHPIWWKYTSSALARVVMRNLCSNADKGCDDLRCTSRPSCKLLSLKRRPQPQVHCQGQRSEEKAAPTTMHVL